jgi:hypothetical protein
MTKNVLILQIIAMQLLCPQGAFAADSGSAKSSSIDAQYDPAQPRETRDTSTIRRPAAHESDSRSTSPPGKSKRCRETEGYYGSIKQGVECAADLHEHEGYYGSIKKHAESSVSERERDGYYGSMNRDVQPRLRPKDEDGYYGSIKKGVECAADLREHEGYYGDLNSSSKPQDTTLISQTNLSRRKVKTSVSGSVRAETVIAARVPEVNPISPTATEAADQTTPVTTGDGARTGEGNSANIQKSSESKPSASSSTTAADSHSLNDPQPQSDSTTRLDDARTSPTNTRQNKIMSKAAADAIRTGFANNTSPAALGENFFNKQAYHLAEECLEEACARNPADQSAHYWLAKTRARLRDPQGAHEEFEVAFRLNPFNDLGRQAKSEMLNQFEAATLSTRPPADPEWLVTQTLMKIREQAHEGGAARRKAAERWARQRIADGELAADRIATNISPWRPRGGSYYRYLDWDSRSEISDPRQINSHYALSDARTQATRARIDGAQRALYMQDAANGLYGQLAEPYRPGRPKLRAFGTNLYVRYYGNESIDDAGPPPADPPLLAKTERFIPKPSITQSKK